MARPYKRLATSAAVYHKNQSQDKLQVVDKVGASQDDHGDEVSVRRVVQQRLRTVPETGAHQQYHRRKDVAILNE